MGSSGRYRCRPWPLFLLVTGFFLTVTAEVAGSGPVVPGTQSKRLRSVWHPIMTMHNPQITELNDFQVLLRFGRPLVLPAFRSWSCPVYRFMVVRMSLCLNMPCTVF